VGDLDGGHRDVRPSVTIGSNVQSSIFYSSWLAGTLGSTDSATARKYGAALFQAQALTWHEAYVVRHDPAAGKTIIETKEDRWATLAAQVQASDPAAYEHLTGRRSDTRMGYALLATVAAFLALPFLFVSALLLLGSFLVVRLAVMLFPAFATLGVFPAGRGLVTGVGRTVGAALVNAVVFGVGAAVTIRVLGLILDPASRLPGWLALVLMPLFGFVMWVALKPFRRLTAMVAPHADPFGEAAGAFGGAARTGGRWVRRAGTAAAAAYTGNVAAAATVAAARDGTTAGEDHRPPVADRVEARPHPAEPPRPPAPVRAAPPVPALESGPHGAVTSEAATPVPADPQWADPQRADLEWADGEQVFTVYRPATDDADDAA
jgi:hypothetical protein